GGGGPPGEPPPPPRPPTLLNGDPSMTETNDALAEGVPGEQRHLHDTGLERQLLGCVLMGLGQAGADALADAAERVTPGDFYLPAHRTVFAALQAMADRRVPLEPRALIAELR